MKFDVQCPFCNKYFKLEGEVAEKIENEVLKNYYEILSHQKALVERERERLESMKAEIKKDGINS